VDAREKGYNWAPLEANDDFLEGSSVEEEEEGGGEAEHQLAVVGKVVVLRAEGEGAVPIRAGVSESELGIVGGGVATSVSIICMCYIRGLLVYVAMSWVMELVIAWPNSSVGSSPKCSKGLASIMRQWRPHL
jgi:hypothetical protein